MDEDGFDDLEEEEEDDDDLPPAPRRRPAGRPGGRRASSRRPVERGRRSGGLFGARRPAAGRRRPGRGFDWEAAEEEDEREPRYGDEGGWEDEEEAVPRRRRATRRRAARRSRITLMDLCTPVFGLATVLPRDPGGVHPGYEQFRQEVLGALQKIESEAPQHGIEKEDAGEARYALALFMDEQVARSEWAGRAQWASEPLNMVLINDPQGGVNFFTHLDGLGDRQRDVKKVYLVCLALGFRGRYAELDPAQQAAQIGDIRQKLVRSIQDSMDSQDVLFPEAYEPAVPLEGKAPPPPAWWLFASIGTIVVLAAFWLGLFWFAGRKPEPAENKLRTIISERAAATGFPAWPPSAGTPAERPS